MSHTATGATSRRVDSGHSDGHSHWHYSARRRADSLDDASDLSYEDGAGQGARAIF